jgi:hypothetical protein
MNHRTTTTTLLVVIAAATSLAAGIVVAIVGSNHSAFAHKEYQKNYDKFNKEDKSGSDGNQYLKCIVVENGGISDNSCNNHDGATPSPIPTSTCNPSTVDGITATPADDTCKATILFSAGDEAVRVFTEECAAIPPPTMFITNDETSVTCIFPSTPPA